MTENRRLLIIGASGHGKVIADIAGLCGYDDIAFLDDDESVKSCAGFPVLGPSSMAASLEGDIAVAVGNAEARKAIFEKLSGRAFPVLVHPSAVIAGSAELGEGTVVMAGAVINPEAVIGRGCIINTCASVDHDCRLGDFVHAAVGARLCGTVSVGDLTWVGAGAVISNNISVCAGAFIGAGTAVVKDIKEPGTYAGVPAKKIK